jgi:hypothetical protein
MNAPFSIGFAMRRGVTGRMPGLGLRPADVATSNANATATSADLVLALLGFAKVTDHLLSYFFMDRL